MLIYGHDTMPELDILARFIKVGVSRGASLDFPQEVRSMAASTTLPSGIPRVDNNAGCSKVGVSRGAFPDVR